MVLPLNKILELKKGTILVSLSSSDREFDIVSFRQSCANISSCHDDFDCVHGIKVINCGFPINFNGEANKVDIEEFELTRSLLTLGILQACAMSKEKGLIPLNMEIQIKIIDHFLIKYGFPLSRKQIFATLGLSTNEKNMQIML